MATGTWVGLDIPLSDFTGLTGRTNLAQLIISGDPNTVYVDNVYFYAEEADLASYAGRMAEAGDLVLGINNLALEDAEALRRAALALRGRSRAQIVVQRGAGRYHVTIPLV